MQRKNCSVSIPVLKQRSNQELVEGARHLVGRSRIITAHLIAYLAEIYARKLHAADGFSYLGNYCMAVLGMSEAEAKRRSHVATIAQKYPVVLEMLLEGSIHLTTVRIIGKCLTAKNHRRVLSAARWKSTAELEQLAAVLNPKADVPTLLRKLPEGRPQIRQTEEAMVHTAAEEEVWKGRAEIALEANSGQENVSKGGGERVAPPGGQEHAGTRGLEVRLDGVLVEVVASSPKPPRLAQLSRKSR